MQTQENNSQQNKFPEEIFHHIMSLEKQIETLLNEIDTKKQELEIYNKDIRTLRQEVANDPNITIDHDYCKRSDNSIIEFAKLLEGITQELLQEQSDLNQLKHDKQKNAELTSKENNESQIVEEEKSFSSEEKKAAKEQIIMEVLRLKLVGTKKTIKSIQKKIRISFSRYQHSMQNQQQQLQFAQRISRQRKMQTKPA